MMEEKKIDAEKGDERIRLEDMDLTPGAKALLVLSQN